MGLPAVFNGLTGRNMTYNATSARVLAESVRSRPWARARGRFLKALRAKSAPVGPAYPGGPARTQALERLVTRQRAGGDRPCRGPPMHQSRRPDPVRLYPAQAGNEDCWSRERVSVVGRREADVPRGVRREQDDVTATLLSIIAKDRLSSPSITVLRR
jgi:hypothetical protein